MRQSQLQCPNPNPREQRQNQPSRPHQSLRRARRSGRTRNHQLQHPNLQLQSRSNRHKVTHTSHKVTRPNRFKVRRPVRIMLFRHLSLHRAFHDPSMSLQCTLRVSRKIVPRCKATHNHVPYPTHIPLSSSTRLFTIRRLTALIPSPL